MNALRASQAVSAGELNALCDELQERNSAGEGEVKTVRDPLDAYAITGGDKPIPVAVIVAVSERRHRPDDRAVLISRSNEMPTIP